jgi:hypothetical protein
MPEGSILSSRPCAFRANNGGNLWSGREDSNLRPLPPEGVAPRRIRCFSTVFPEASMRSGGLCSRSVHGLNLIQWLRPLSIGAA